MGWLRKQKRGNDGYDNDDRNGDGDGAPAGIVIFGYRCWLDQAAHASDCTLDASCWSLPVGLEECDQEQHAEQQVDAAESQVSWL